MAGNKTLSNISPEATEQTNTTGVMTPILELQPDDGLKFILENMANGGRGIPLYLDLKDGSDNDLPLDTSLTIQFKGHADEDRRTVSDVHDNIQPWNARSVSEQQNEDYVDSVRVNLKSSALEVFDIDKAYISIDSSTQIDWSNSSAYIDNDHVREVSK